MITTAQAVYYFVGQTILLGCFTGATLKGYGRIARGWWLVGALALTGCLFDPPKELFVPLVVVICVATVGLVAMALDLVGPRKQR